MKPYACSLLSNHLLYESSCKSKVKSYVYVAPYILPPYSALVDTISNDDSWYHVTHSSNVHVLFHNSAHYHCWMIIDVHSYS